MNYLKNDQSLHTRSTSQQGAKVFDGKLEMQPAV